MVALLFLASLFIAGIARRHPGMVNPSQALSDGIQWVSFNRFTPDIWLELLVVLGALVNIRSIWLAVISYRANSPIEVKPLDNATRDRGIDTHRLDVTFGDYLALSRLYAIPTLPGDQEPDRLIEILNAPTSRGWTGILSVAVAYAFPRRAFLVTASLLDRDENRRCGVSVQVRRFPGSPVHLESQWSATYERALQRAAYGIGAHITQQTKACRKIPWSEWERRKRRLPALVFRDYQRAKQMVGERRYDEALALYHSALRADADNIAMRYDVGQLYERLGLYPDALMTYMGLVDEIFPDKHIDTSTLSGNGPKRVAIPLWWPREASRDPFIIRYRYVVTLGQGHLLAKELLALESPVLGEDQEYEDRPWRTIEISDIGRLLSTRLDVLYSAYCKRSLASLLDKARVANDGSLNQEVAAYLLKCAEHEAWTLARDIKRAGLLPRVLMSRRKSALTSVAVRQAWQIISYRLEKLNSIDANSANTSVSPDFVKGDLKKIEANLKEKSGYSKNSGNWLEHYNAACHYALAIVNDEEERSENREYAYEAVAALDRAARYGDQVEFVTSKKYWLQTGDPDLKGLRYYTCFRAFEARVYGHPLPATADLSKYESYRFLRAVLNRAARHLENAWRSRAQLQLTHADFENWWRQELRAWELAIRIGRFHDQWQTRHETLEAIRNWIEAFQPEAQPIPYPNISRGDYPSDIGDYRQVRRVLDETKNIFDFLATRCGRLVPSNDANSESLYGKTRSWSEYAAGCSRSGTLPSVEKIAELCLERAAVWAALRQWAQSPDNAHQKIFEDTIASHRTPSSRED